MSDFEQQFSKEMRREKIGQVILLVIIFGYFYLTTSDSDVGTAKLLFVVILSTAYIAYRIDKLEKLIVKVYTNLSH